MRDRYYIRFEKVLKPYQKALYEWQRYQYGLSWEERKYTENSIETWFLEKHNVVISHNANGVTKLGFATPEDVTLFALRYS